MEGRGSERRLSVEEDSAERSARSSTTTQPDSNASANFGGAAVERHDSVHDSGANRDTEDDLDFSSVSDGDCECSSFSVGSLSLSAEENQGPAHASDKNSFTQSVDADSGGGEARPEARNASYDGAARSASDSSSFDRELDAYMMALGGNNVVATKENQQDVDNRQDVGASGRSGALKDPVARLQADDARHNTSASSGDGLYEDDFDFDNLSFSDMSDL